MSGFWIRWESTCFSVRKELSGVWVNQTLASMILRSVWPDYASRLRWFGDPHSHPDRSVVSMNDTLCFMKMLTGQCVPPCVVKNFGLCRRRESGMFTLRARATCPLASRGD